MEVERFVSRRGTLANIWSDNSTNFVGEEKELRKNIQRTLVTVLQVPQPKHIPALKSVLNSQAGTRENMYVC